MGCTIQHRQRTADGASGCPVSASCSTVPQLNPMAPFRWGGDRVGTEGQCPPQIHYFLSFASADWMMLMRMMMGNHLTTSSEHCTLTLVPCLLWHVVLVASGPPSAGSKGREGGWGQKQCPAQRTSDRSKRYPRGVGNTLLHGHTPCSKPDAGGLHDPWPGSRVSPAPLEIAPLLSGRYPPLGGGGQSQSDSSPPGTAPQICTIVSWCNHRASAPSVPCKNFVWRLWCLVFPMLSGPK